MWMEEVKDKKGNVSYKYFERYTDPYSEKPKRTSVTLTSKSNQARKQAAKQLQAKINQKISAPIEPNITFKEALDSYMKYYKKTVKKSSYLSMQSTKGATLKLVGNDTIIRNIDEPFLRNVVEKAYYDERYSFNYTKKIKALVIAIMSYAKKNNYQVEIPCFRLDLNLRQEEEKEKYLETRELRLIIDQLKSNSRNLRKADMVEFLALTGLRYGELIALRNEDFHDTYIHVNGTIDHRDGKYSDNPVRTPPKTAKAYRSVTLTDRAIEIIKKVQTENELMKAEFPDYRDLDYLFTNKNGLPIDYRTFEPTLRKAAESAGVNKQVTTHYLRHTHVSLLAELNVPIKAVMDRVGHKDVSTTMEIYSHVTEKMRTTVIDKLNKLEY